MITQLLWALILIQYDSVFASGYTRKLKKLKKKKCNNEQPFCQEYIDQFEGFSEDQICATDEVKIRCQKYCTQCKIKRKKKKFSNTLLYEPGNLAIKQNGILLSKGLTSKIIASSGNPVSYANGGKSTDPFHANPDGAAVFSHPSGNGWVYVSNSEVNFNKGGVGALYFNPEGEVIEYSLLLTGTSRNCGGGKTPWGTWLSGEETHDGQIWEIDPWSKVSQKTFIGDESGNYYESAAFDNRDERNPAVYITTDFINGPLIRYLADPALIEDAIMSGNNFSILGRNSTSSNRSYLVLEPSSKTFLWSQNIDEGKASAETHFPYSEGINIRGNHLYFTVKGLKLLFDLDLDAQTYTYTSTVSGLFDGQPDQLTRITEDGDNDSTLYFCEDSAAKCGIHGLDSEGRFFTILESDDYSTETTGLAFSPDGKHMYVSFQYYPGQIFDISREDGLPFDGPSLEVTYH